MKGNNEMRLCAATMIEAMQEYVDRIMPNQKQTVRGVREIKDGYSSEFVIDMATEEARDEGKD